MAKYTEAQLAAWREARIQHLVATKTARQLAAILVELEDDLSELSPGFLMDEEWPEHVRHLKVT